MNQLTISGYHPPAFAGEDGHCQRCAVLITHKPPRCVACIDALILAISAELAEAPVADNTRRAYILAFRRWALFMTRRGLGVDWIEAEHLVDWIGELDSEGGRPSAIVATASHLRGAIMALAARGTPGIWTWPDDPMLRRELARARASARGTARQAAPIRIEELGRIVAAIAERRPRAPSSAIRDRAIALLWWCMAARTEDIARVRWGDIELRTDGGLDIVLTSGKTGARRATVYPAADHLELCPVAALEAWSVECLGRGITEILRLDLPVPWRDRRIVGTLGGVPVTLRGVRAMAVRWFRIAGLPRGFSPHSFRVGALVVAHELGAPRPDLLALGGHTDGATLDRYLRSLARKSSIAFRLL